MESENYYKKLRNRFLPKNLKVIFILESPPAGGNFFFNENSGNTGEPLFKTMMDTVLSINPETKKEGLKEFAKKGYFLVDATYTPVNNIHNFSRRNRIILKNYDNLVEDLRKVIKNRDVRIILVKANIYRLLQKPLTRDGFNVVNNGIIIPFPSHGWQRSFSRKIKKLLKKSSV